MIVGRSPPNIGPFASEQWAVHLRTVGVVSWVPFGIPGNAHGIAEYSFANPDTGYAQEFEHGLYKTTDGGGSWSALPPSPALGLNGVHFVSADTGFVTGTSYDAGLYQTTDGGMTWSAVISGESFTSLKEVDFPDAGVGYVAANTAQVFRLTRQSTVGLSEMEATQLSVFPNPTTGETRILLPSGAEEVILTDALGAVVLRRNVRGTQHLDLRVDAPGVYLIQMRTKGGIATEKLLVQGR
jgi:hypothetical protein